MGLMRKGKKCFEVINCFTRLMVVVVVDTYLSPTAEHLILASRPRCTVSVTNLVSKCAATVMRLTAGGDNPIISTVYVALTCVKL